MNIEPLLRYGLVLTILPAFLVILLAVRLAPAQGGITHSNREWSRFLLVSAVALLLPFAVFTNHLFTDTIGLLSLLLIPALVGIFALLFINWRGVKELLDTDQALAVTCLVLLVVLLSASGIGQREFPVAILFGSLIVALAWAVFRRLRGGLLIAAGILSIVLLLSDATGLTSSPAVYDEPGLRTAYKLVSGLVPILALAAAAMLIHTAFQEQPDGAGPHGPIQVSAQQKRKTRLHQFFYLVLAALILLALCAAVFRSAVMVNATGRALEDHLPFFPIVPAVIIGVFLALMGGKRSRNAGIAFLVCVPFALLSAYLLGWQVDPHAVTAARAERIAQALRAYRQEAGVYPESLAELTPDYLPLLLGPLNGRGTRWCYQGEGDAYRLGYVLYQRYSHVESNPYRQGFSVPQFQLPIENSFKIETLAREGKPPTVRWNCLEDMDRMRETGGL